MSKSGALIVFLICFPLSVTGLAQSAANRVTESDSKSQADRKAVKKSGIALIDETEGPVAQIQGPETRLRLRVQTAQLLMLCDEKRAGKWLGDAVADYKQFRAAVDPDNWRYLTQYAALTQIRRDLIRIMAASDAEQALSFLYSTPLPPDPYSNPRYSRTNETELELIIATEVVRKNPKRALELGRKVLKESFSPDLVGFLSQLERQDRELAVQLADEIAGKIIDQKLLDDYSAAVLAANLIGSASSAGNEGDQPPSVKATLFSEERYRSLLQKMVSDALSYSHQDGVNSPERYIAVNLLSALKSVRELDKFVAGSTKRVEKKLAEISFVPSRQPPDASDYSTIVASKPFETALRAIEGFPEGLREQYFIQLANQQADAGNISSARQIVNERILTPQQRIQWLSNLERYEITAALKQGNIEGAIRMAGSLRRSDRAQYVAEIVAQVGSAHERSRAIALLEQAHNLLSPSIQARDESHLNALLAIALAFSRHDPKRSFEILEPLIDQLNELCAAARTLSGFGIEGYYDDEEPDLSYSNSVGPVATSLSEAMGQMALIDFERAKSVCERINLPEIRIKMFLALAGYAIEGSQEE